jgi:hypothetical protein
MMPSMPTDFTGTWIADMSQSAFAGPKPAALRVQIEHCDPELREEVLVAKADGTEDRAIFVCRTTGHVEMCSFNGTAIQGRANWMADELIIESWMELGPRKMYFCDCWSLAADGRTLIMEHRDDALAGQRVVLAKASANLASI